MYIPLELLEHGETCHANHIPTDNEDGLTRTWTCPDYPELEWSALVMRVSDRFITEKTPRAR